MVLGEFIKTKRIEVGLTQEQLANVINKKKDFISSIENGKVKSIKSDYVFPIAKALKCDASIFFNGIDNDGKFINPHWEINTYDENDFEPAYDENGKEIKTSSLANMTLEEYYELTKKILDSSNNFTDQDKKMLLMNIEYAMNSKK